MSAVDWFALGFLVAFACTAALALLNDPRPLLICAVIMLTAWLWALLGGY